ncbi:MAG: hypothetical protein MUO50_16615 [Longimicrobiales bacterium]|nr:hypothetical protein [Longimicrobiales bacterium]
MIHTHPPRRSARLMAYAALAILSACADASGLLGPEALQGVEGVVLLGPLCPVVSEANPCPDQPYQAVIDILDHQRRFVGHVRSGEDGRFRAGLQPGAYILRPKSGNPFPRGEEEDLEVEEGVYTSVTVHFDTGIR